MHKTRNRLLVTLVLMTVAWALAGPPGASARARGADLVGSTTLVGTPTLKPGAVATQGEPEVPGNTAPIPTVGHYGAQTARDDTSLPSGLLRRAWFVWVSRIWAAWYAGAIH